MDVEAWSELELLERVHGGHRNEVWLGRSDGEYVSVRRSARSEMSLAWEVALIDRLAANGVPVAGVVPTAGGARWVNGVVVQRWIDGRPPSSPADWRDVAAVLGQVHRVGTTVGQRPGCCVVTQLAERRRSVDADLDVLPEAVRQLVLDVFAAFADAPVSLVHGDPDASNIRIDERGEVWLLDWDESRVDAVWHDLSNLGIRVLDEPTHLRAMALSDAWEVANAWSAEPEYARRRLVELCESAGRLRSG